MKARKSKEESDSNVIVVPWQWFEEERDREYEKMLSDIEQGVTTIEELQEKNALRIGDCTVCLEPNINRHPGNLVNVEECLNEYPYKENEENKEIRRPQRAKYWWEIE